jgi:hypothetical protein
MGVAVIETPSLTTESDILPSELVLRSKSLSTRHLPQRIELPASLSITEAIADLLPLSRIGPMRLG